uniref:Uncharacterized protein n=1 Tax=Lepeophtheirus salmonis TaxID=72036 RepID=A0A0K2UTH0_LEPSM
MTIILPYTTILSSLLYALNSLSSFVTFEVIHLFLYPPESFAIKNLFWF